MSYLILFVVVTAFLVVPVMVGARIVNAEKTGFGAALLAVVIFAVISVGIDVLVVSRLLAFLVKAIAGGLILSMVLGTTFLRGLAVSIISTIIQILAALLLAGIVVGGAGLAA